MKDVVFFLHRVYPDGKKKRDDISLDSFVKALKLIKSRFKVVPLQALFEEKSKERRAAITFDDGYTDNFVYAYPVLKKMKIPAHLFLSSSRIRKSGVRKTLFDYWNGNASFSELCQPVSMYFAHEDFIKNGSSEEFLSWEELEKMKDVFSYGAHGVNHFSYPYSSEIKDFFSGEKVPWQLYLYHNPPFVGQPIFPTRSALDVKRFLPSKELLDFCKNFKKEGNWKESLRSEIEKRGINLGEFETEENARVRIRDEMLKSKRDIESNLGIKVNTFAWPFGHYSEFSKPIAAEVFDYVFTIKKGFITESSDPKELPRVSIGKDLFTLIGRLITFSTDLGFKVYRTFKRGKVL
ncbi:Polysaccharide deacetylase [Desulfurobacterium pacificum]|uniref:Polysaccharide deacetylase n=1 Tax=Desulfurobacterium pacificum TaxID=240166 RepID=A0ABY1NKK3_9BACT|nr:polysaccharide deacetylase family protein [Desulfurobacterium pacificum]SMP11983.1 Polysaccharide deacetylase [Desulfurobacterium pacificum]